MLRMEHLARLHGEFSGATRARVAEFALGSRHLAFNSRPAIMGVVNLSPDSWYRESVCLSEAAAIARGRILAAQGADIIDLGAESTLAHAQFAEADLQNTRLLPVVSALSAEGISVSVETYHPAVARACLEKGARVINLTGTSHFNEIARMAADHEAAMILCYVQGENVRQVLDFNAGADPIHGMRAYFAELCERATRAGARKLLIDPGLGFYYRNLQDSAERVRHQMSTFLNTFRLRELGFPVCHALPHAFEYFGEEVRCAEPFFAVLASLGSTDLFRTHEVPRVKSVLDTMAIYEPGGAQEVASATP